MSSIADDLIYLCCCAVVNVYVPNSGDGLKRLEYRVGSWDVEFAIYLSDLSKKKPVILTGEDEGSSLVCYFQCMLPSEERSKSSVVLTKRASLQETSIVHIRRLTSQEKPEVGWLYSRKTRAPFRFPSA